MKLKSVYLTIMRKHTVGNQSRDRSMSNIAVRALIITQACVLERCQRKKMKATKTQFAGSRTSSSYVDRVAVRLINMSKMEVLVILSPSINHDFFLATTKYIFNSFRCTIAVGVIRTIPGPPSNS